ncbi:uncharacterized protein LOC135204908 [Macrobrachium nipponense]|uniref:uncharacterized protein LOC135204908 n=1 Tax=Macrobrachium nipponense TaxID=159736 RepID=UPI0030C8129D
MLGLQIAPEPFGRKTGPFENNERHHQMARPLMDEDITEFSEATAKDGLEESKNSEEQNEDGIEIVDGAFKQKLQELLGIQESGIREAIESVRSYAVSVPETVLKTTCKDIQAKLNEMEYTVERAVHCALKGREIDAASMLTEQAAELQLEFQKIVSGYHGTVTTEEVRAGDTNEKCSTKCTEKNGSVNEEKILTANGDHSKVELLDDRDCNREEEMVAVYSAGYSKSLCNKKKSSRFYKGKIPEGDHGGIILRTNGFGRTSLVEEALSLVLSPNDEKSVREAVSALLDAKCDGTLLQLIASKLMPRTDPERRIPATVQGDKLLMENFIGGYTIWIPESWHSLAFDRAEYTEMKLMSHLVKTGGSRGKKIEEILEMKYVDEGIYTSLSGMEGVWFKASRGLNRRDSASDGNVNIELSFDKLLPYFLLTERYSVYAVEICQRSKRCTSRFVICRSTDQCVPSNWVPYKYMQPGGPWYVTKDERSQTIVNKYASRIRRCNAMILPVEHEMEFFFKLDKKFKKELCDKLALVLDI